MLYNVARLLLLIGCLAIMGRSTCTGPQVNLAPYYNQMVKQHYQCESEALTLSARNLQGYCTDGQARVLPVKLR